MAGDFERWVRSPVDVPAAYGSCFCTGKCRTLGYCPNGSVPPIYPPDRSPRFLNWMKQEPTPSRIRVKAWRKPNEDGLIRPTDPPPADPTKVRTPKENSNG